MNDNQFDDIGKRLHDLEADPPKDGWKKISSDLSAGDSSGSHVWLRKNWWKPMFLLIPVLVYLPFSDLTFNPSTLSSTEITNASVERAITNNENDHKHALAETTETNTGERIVEEQVENSVEENELIASTKTISKQKDQPKILQEKQRAINQPDDHTVMETNPGEHENKLTDEVIVAPVTEIIDTATLNNNTTIVIASDPGDTLKASSPDEDEKQPQKSKGSWRMSVAFAPQFVANTVKPLTNDEVFVTEINPVTRAKPTGYGLAIGVGKSITPNFYLDGQLSFSTFQQTIQYGYSDGTVDTLLTVEQPDKSYRVTPVYAIENREVSSSYNYGGVRLAATYYFWSAPRSRFNLSAALGAHYLLSATVKEKINDEWVTLSNDQLNRMNYSFTAGAGYNIMMGKGWELMINPTLTWFLKEIKSHDVPYSVREEAMGLNFMLSKTLGSK